MLAKLTSKNQITIPKKIMDKLPDVQHFDVDLQEGMVVMKPLLLYDLEFAIKKNRNVKMYDRIYAKSLSKSFSPVS